MPKKFLLKYSSCINTFTQVDLALALYNSTVDTKASTLTLTSRLKSFESNVGLSRKAFRLGKFVQDVNALRNSQFDLKQDLALSMIAYGGEELYYFVEQFIWLSKSGLINPK